MDATIRTIWRQPNGADADDDASWADLEMAEADLGDKRLNRRLVRIAKSLAAAPHESIPSASDGLAETLTVYRFFDNEKVTLGKVLEPHIASTRRRMGKHAVVLVAHDTTELDYTACTERHRDGGPLSRERQLGYYLHPSIAFTPEGVCLGTLHANIWARDPAVFGTSRATKKQKPIEEKESYRWLDGWNVISRTARAVPQCQIINVSDRESDIYALLQKATRDMIPNAHFVIRQRDNRCLPERVDDPKSRAYKKFSSVLSETPTLGTITIQTPRSKKSKARLASVEIRSAHVVLKDPATRRRDELTEVAINVLWAIERDTPEGVEGIEWILFTDLPCTTLEEAVQVVEYYSGRWGIEVTHCDCKQHLGLEDPANRVPKAVQRTAPMAMFLYSLIIVWFATEGHAEWQIPERPWYWWKSEPSSADMLTTLRRKSWEDKLSGVSSAATPLDNFSHLQTYLATLAG